MKLVSGYIGINVLKLRLREFQGEINRLMNKKTKKEPCKRNKKDVLKNTEALYDGIKIIEVAFVRQVFSYGGRSKIDVDYDLETYGLTKREFEIFKNLFSYDNPNELWNALMDTDKEKYAELLNDLKIKQNLLDEQINIKTDIERERLVSLVDTVEDI